MKQFEKMNLKIGLNLRDAELRRYREIKEYRSMLSEDRQLPVRATANTVEKQNGQPMIGNTSSLLDLTEELIKWVS
jgi:hypothetical protein